MVHSDATPVGPSPLPSPDLGTDPLSTDAPTTDPSSTDASAIDPVEPSTDASSIDAPTTDPLSTDAPATDPLSTDAPATDPSSTEHLETELKLGASSDFVIPDLAGSFPDLVVAAAPTLILEAVYFDTADLALTRSKVSLRHRTGEGAARWTLKLPKDRAGPVDPDAEVAGTLRRREFNVMSDDGSSVPSTLASLVIAWTRGDALDAVVTLRTERHRLLLQDGKTGEEVGEIDDDTVEVRYGGELPEMSELSEGFREIEVEVNERATNDVLPTVAAALRFAGAQEADSVSKVGRALGPAGAVPPMPLGLVVDHDSTVSTLVRAALSRRTAVLISVDHAIRLDDDPEAVRRASAAVRRLRTDLRTLRPYLEDSAVSHLRDELGWLQSELGQVRDVDVIGLRVRAGLAALETADRDDGQPLLEHLTAAREQTRDALVAAMCTPRYVSLLRSLVDACATPPVGSELAELPVTPSADRIARRPVRRVRRDLAALATQTDPPSDEQFRELRRRIRQARFGIQLVDPVLPGSSRVLTRSLNGAQDMLGLLCDAVETDEWLRSTDAVFANPRLSFIVGQLVADQRATAESVRTGWREIEAAITQPADRYLRR